MSEANVGITIYLNQHPEFTATFKHRMTDFLVQEIGLDGKVVFHNSAYKQGQFNRIGSHLHPKRNGRRNCQC